MSRHARILPVIMAALLMTLPASSQNSNDKKAAINRLKEEIRFIDGELKAATSKHQESYNRLLLLQKKSASRKALVEESDRAIKDLKDSIDVKNRQIHVLESEIDTLEKYYSALVYNTYKNRDNRVWYMYLLASENPGQGYRRYSYLKNLAETMNSEAREILLAKERLASETDILDGMVQEATGLRKEREKEYSTLMAEEKKTQQLVQTLARDKKKYKADLDRKRKEMDRLNKEVQKIVSKEVSKKDNIDYTVSGKFEQNKGKIPWPVQGVVTEKFGVQKHPVYRHISLPANNGITITAKKGSEAKCVFEGVVKQIMIMPGYNQCVLVQHGEFFTFYCKLSKTSVKAGQKIAAGATIGTLETTDDDNAQLHFQIWKGNNKQNPENWLK